MRTQLVIQLTILALVCCTINAQRDESCTNGVCTCQHDTVVCQGKNLERLGSKLLVPGRITKILVDECTKLAIYDSWLSQTNITSLTIKSSTLDVMPRAFVGASKKLRVLIESSSLDTIQSLAFGHTTIQLVQFKKSTIRLAIKDRAFAHSNLKEFLFQDSSVRVIETGAFNLSNIHHTELRGSSIQDKIQYSAFADTSNSISIIDCDIGVLAGGAIRPEYSPTPYSITIRDNRIDTVGNSFIFYFASGTQQLSSVYFNNNQIRDLAMNALHCFNNRHFLYYEISDNVIEIMRYQQHTYVHKQDSSVVTGNSFGCKPFLCFLLNKAISNDQHHLFFTKMAFSNSTCHGPSYLPSNKNTPFKLFNSFRDYTDCTEYLTDLALKDKSAC